MSNWQPIETAPRDGTCVLLSTGRHVYDGAWSIDIDGDGAGWTDFSVYDWGLQHFSRLYPTHWMPLPAPPQIEEAE